MRRRGLHFPERGSSTRSRVVRSDPHIFVREGAMRTFTYRASLEPGERTEVVVVAFPDVPEAITEGEGEAEALRQAEDALGTALLSYSLRGLKLPRARTRGGLAVTVAPEVAAKLAVLEAFAAAYRSRSSRGDSMSARTRRAASSIRCMRPSCRGSVRRLRCSDDGLSSGSRMGRRSVATWFR